jgi:hypothetical protein
MREQLRQVTLSVNLLPLARAGQAAQDRRRPAATLVSDEA